MSRQTTKRRRRRRVVSGQGRESNIETRIDAPHPLRREQAEASATPEPVEPAPDALRCEEQAAEQLHRQAEQLAEHLRLRQKQIDHREAQLNATFAQLERDTATARLWANEREAELQEAEEKLAAREARVQTSLQHLATADASRRKKLSDDDANFALREGAIREKEEKLVEREKAGIEADREFEAKRRPREESLRRREQKIDTRREASLQLVRQLLAGVERRRETTETHTAKHTPEHSKPTEELLARERMLRRTAKSLQQKQQELDEAETRLAEAQKNAEAIQQQLFAGRQELLDEGKRQRKALATEHDRAKEQLYQQREAVRRRSEHVDQCHRALEKLRGELGNMHRETLEIRLATEELWAQLSGAAPPAALIRSLGTIRAKLAEQYRLAGAELAEQKAELGNVRRELVEQHAKLIRQKKRFEKWSAADKEEISQQAQRLAAREEELHGQQADLQERSHAWQAERLDYEREIRRLRVRLSDPAEVQLT